MIIGESKERKVNENLYLKRIRRRKVVIVDKDNKDKFISYINNLPELFDIKINLNINALRSIYLVED